MFPSKYFATRYYAQRYFPNLGAEAVAAALESMYTSDKLLKSIRNLGMIPNTAVEGAEDADLLIHADEALRVHLLPRILKLKEEYYVVRERVSLVSGTARYRIPSHAILNKLREVYHIDGSDRFQLDMIPMEELHLYNGPGSGSPAGFIFEGNDVVLVPDKSPTYTGSIEYVYFFRPGDLVLAKNARQVTAVNLSSKIVTFGSAVPVGWDNADKFDIHSRHSGAEPKLWDQAATTVSGTQITFTGAIDGTVFGTKAVEVGDWVCLAGEAAVVGLPAEFQPLLSRAVALHFAEAIGDTAQAQIHGQILEKYFQELEKAAERRMESKPVRLGGRGRGILNTQSRRFW